MQACSPPKPTSQLHGHKRSASTSSPPTLSRRANACSARSSVVRPAPAPSPSILPSPQHRHRLQPCRRESTPPCPPCYRTHASRAPDTWVICGRLAGVSPSGLQPGPAPAATLVPRRAQHDCDLSIITHAVERSQSAHGPPGNATPWHPHAAVSVAPRRPAATRSARYQQQNSSIPATEQRSARLTTRPPPSAPALPLPNATPRSPPLVS